MITDTRKGYGWISILLHWSIAALVIALYFIGEEFEDLGREAGAFLRGLHYSLGMVALCLIVPRILWRIVQGHPEEAADPRLVQLLARLVQWGLLLVPLLLVISGPLTIWTNGRPIDVFGVLQLASPFERNHDLHEFFEETHELLSSLILPLVGLHVLGALKHLVLDRDGIFMRMLRPGAPQ